MRRISLSLRPPRPIEAWTAWHGHDALGLWFVIYFLGLLAVAIVLSME